VGMIIDPVDLIAQLWGEEEDSEPVELDVLGENETSWFDSSGAVDWAETIAEIRAKGDIPHTVADQYHIWYMGVIGLRS